MKKLSNITGIILFIVLFCSCTSSYKLMERIDIGKPDIIAKFTPVSGTVLNVGTNTIRAIIDIPCIECEVAKMHLKVVIILASAIVLIYIFIFISDKIKSYEKSI